MSNPVGVGSDETPPRDSGKGTEKNLEQVLREKVPAVLDSIPGSKRKELRSVRIEQHTVSVRSGPLPPAEDVFAWERMVPGAADRILKMTETQLAHRVAIETHVIKSQQRQGAFGQYAALGIAIFVTSLATYAGVAGHDAFASILGGTTVVGLVSAFVYSQHAQRSQLTKKQSEADQIEKSLEPQSNPQIKKKRDR